MNFWHTIPIISAYIQMIGKLAVYILLVFFFIIWTRISSWFSQRRFKRNRVRKQWKYKNSWVRRHSRELSAECPKVQRVQISYRPSWISTTNLSGVTAFYPTRERDWPTSFSEVDEREIFWKSFAKSTFNKHSRTRPYRINEFTDFKGILIGEGCIFIIHENREKNLFILHNFRYKVYR